MAGRTQRIERRSFRRVNVLQGLGILILAQVGSGGGLILDLGENGVSIQLAGPIPLLAEWDVEFELDGGSSPVKSKAQTIWQKDGVLGLRFVDLAADCRNQLSSWLDRKRGEPKSKPSSSGQQAVSGPARSPSSPLSLNGKVERPQSFERESSIAVPASPGISVEPERQPDRYSYLFQYDEPRSNHGLWVTLVLLMATTLLGLRFRAELRSRILPLYSDVVARLNSQPSAPPTPAAIATPDSTAAPRRGSIAADGNVLPSTGMTTDVGPKSAESKNEDNSVTAANLYEKSNNAERAESDDTKEPTKAARQPRKVSSRQRPAAPAVLAPENGLLELAQKYLHGEGVRGDCDQGMIYLRAAMRRPSAAAASQMGALYATGTCVPLDRVAAYRWFSSALQMTPSNPWLARERDQLDAQMSSAERLQAKGQ